MEMETEAPPTPSDLVAILEQATLMAKKLQKTTDPSQIYQIQTCLSLFLSHHFPPPAPPADSLSSAVVGAGDTDYEIGGGEPMQLGDDEEEQNSNVAKVEERMRECFIQNKRLKRPLSPSSVVAEQRQRYENEGGSVLDSVGSRLRSLELIYQFHA